MNGLNGRGSLIDKKTGIHGVTDGYLWTEEHNDLTNFYLEWEELNATLGLEIREH